MWKIEFYEKENGKVPLEDFLSKLDKKMQAKAFQEIDILKKFGNELKKPHSKLVKDGIYELRIKFASDISRIFYFFIKNNKIILTNGFIKKTTKTPKTEIDKAIKYKKDYDRRYSHD